MKIFFLLMVLLSFLPLQSSSLTFLANPASLHIKEAIPGRQPLSVTDSSTMCSLIVSSGKLVTLLAALDSPLQAHTTLKMRLDLKGYSTSSIALGSVPRDLTPKISEGAYETIRVTYEYEATVAAGVIPQQTRTLFLTLLEEDR